MATNPERSAEEKAADRAVDREGNDKNATNSSDITADAADRYADTIRPSWVQLGPAEIAQKGATAWGQESSNASTVAAVVPQSASTREDTDAEIELAAASIVSVKKVRRKTLLWSGGVAAGLLILILFSATTQKEQETSLWESEKVASEAPVEKRSREKLAETKSGAKIEAESPSNPAAEPSAIAIGSSLKQGEEPLSAPETKVLTGSSEAVEQPTSEPIADKPVKEAAQPPKVRIRVTTVPVKATLTLDGTSVPNPFDQWLPKNGEHLFVAKANGYLKKFRTVAFDRNKELSLQLAPKKKKGRTARRTAKKTSSRRKSARRVSRRASRPSSLAPRAQPSRKGFISENPY